MGVTIHPAPERVRGVAMVPSLTAAPPSAVALQRSPSRHALRGSVNPYRPVFLRGGGLADSPFVHRTGGGRQLAPPAPPPTDAACLRAAISGGEGAGSNVAG